MFAKIKSVTRIIIIIIMHNIQYKCVGIDNKLQLCSCAKIAEYSVVRFSMAYCGTFLQVDRRGTVDRGRVLGLGRKKRSSKSVVPIKRI